MSTPVHNLAGLFALAFASRVLQVMDDNKILTLASNERIPLTPSMRLLLEINHMNHCSPATVSRGGVIFVNADDIGWKPVRFSFSSVRGMCRFKQKNLPLKSGIPLVLQSILCMGTNVCVFYWIATLTNSLTTFCTGGRKLDCSVGV